MNKAGLIAALAANLEVSKTQAAGVMETVLGTIINATVTEGECIVPGLGKLKLVDVGPTSGVAMGTAWSKPAHKKVKLALSKAGKELGN